MCIYMQITRIFISYICMYSAYLCRKSLDECIFLHFNAYIMHFLCILAAYFMHAGCDCVCKNVHLFCLFQLAFAYLPIYCASDMDPWAWLSEAFLNWKTSKMWNLEPNATSTSKTRVDFWLIDSGIEWVPITKLKLGEASATPPTNRSETSSSRPLYPLQEFCNHPPVWVQAMQATTLSTSAAVPQLGRRQRLGRDWRRRYCHWCIGCSRCHEAGTPTAAAAVAPVR